MSVRYYDEALQNKIQNWIKDKSVRILKVNETFETLRIKADEGLDRPIKLPIINITRSKSFEILHLGRRPLSCSGRVVAEAKDKSAAIPLNAIPISLSYQIDVYTQRYEEADAYLREIIFNLVNHPKLSIIIPYQGLKFKHNAYVRLLSEVTDNSDVSEKLFDSQFTRWTLSITIDDAYLFSAPTSATVTFDEIDLDIKNLELGMDDEIEIVVKNES